MQPYARHLARVNIPQTSQADPAQVVNSAGGFSFEMDCWGRLQRFLVLGSEGGTYYVGERKLTLDNVGAVRECLKADGLRLVNHIAHVSDDGRAPKNDPALLALAIAAKEGDLATRRAAFAVLPKVARIGTHLFHFAEFVKLLGGWGRATTSAFAKWYTDMPVKQLALQAIKYQQRDGWSHRDLLRKSHPLTTDENRKIVFDWICRGWESVGSMPHPVEDLAPIWAFERAKKSTSVRDIRGLIEQYHLPQECVPNEFKKEPGVWESLLPHMGLTALIRNLGKMTSVGILGSLSEGEKIVRDKLGDVEALRRGRVHPLSILVAAKIYGQGHGEKGSLAWTPNSRIVDFLDKAFYASFKAVEPTGKNHLLAVDISGSMFGARIAGMPLTCAEAAAAMALVTANVEPNHAMYAFTSTYRQLDISPNLRLDEVNRRMQALSRFMGGTDCALPMVHALANKIPVDVFHVYTDCETWAGGTHPHVALQEYRRRMNRAAKLVVFGMASNEFTIADPKDSGMLDVVGFDTAVPQLVADFARR